MAYNRLRELREDNDYTQQKIADMLYINRRTYSAYETGVNNLPVEILVKLAKIYNTSTDYILELTDKTEPYK